jgi:thioredoxin 1
LPTPSFSHLFFAIAFATTICACGEASQPKEKPATETADTISASPTDDTSTSAAMSWKGVEKLGEQQFQEKVLASAGVTVVDFSAIWCGPCKQLEPVLHAVAKQYEGKVNFANIDVDDSPNLAAELQIQSIPYIVFYKNGEKKSTMIGFQSEEELKAEIDGLLK